MKEYKHLDVDNVDVDSSKIYDKSFGEDFFLIEYNGKVYKVDNTTFEVIPFTNTVFFLQGESITCEFEEGMNWSEFIDSSFNEAGFYLHTFGTSQSIPQAFRGGTLVCRMGWPLNDSNGNDITENMMIQKFETYSSVEW